MLTRQLGLRWRPAETHGSAESLCHGPAAAITLSVSHASETNSQEERSGLRLPEAGGKGELDEGGPKVPNSCDREVTFKMIHIINIAVHLKVVKSKS